MTGRFLQSVARLSLAILIVANGPANVYAQGARQVCGCSDAPIVVVAAPETGAGPHPCPCCPLGHGCETEDGSQEAETNMPDGDQPASEERPAPSAAQVEADGPCCPRSPHCPNGCYVCGVCKPSAVHARAAFVPDRGCVGSSSPELALTPPLPPLTELLHVPRA
jgi:hypothetical protein